MTRINVETEISDIKVSLKRRIAKQADGSVIPIGDTMVLATVCSSEADSDFFPLTVEYVERPMQVKSPVAL